MLTHYVTKRPDMPTFVGQVRHHMAAARGLDNTILDTDPKVGSVRIDDDKLSVSLQTDQEGNVQHFLWRKDPGLFDERERFELRRTDKEEVLTHSEISNSVMDESVLEQHVQTAGFSLDDGGLVWTNNRLNAF